MPFIVILTLLVSAAFAIDATPWLRGGFGWRWPYTPLSLAHIAFFAAACALYLAIALILIRRPTARLLLAWALLSAVALSLIAAGLREGDPVYALFTRTVSVVSSGEHWMGTTVNWEGGAWRDWTGQMAALGDVTSNAATSPPGMPLVYGLAADGFARAPALTDALYDPLLPAQCHNYALLETPPSDWAAASVGMLMPLWAALAVFPLYAVARRLTRPESPGARWTVACWPLAPGMLAFAGSSSTLFPLLALTAFWGLTRALDAGARRDRFAWALTGGLAFGLGTFANFVFLPIIPLYGLFALLRFVRGESRVASFGGLVALGGIFAAGALLPWLIWTALTGQTPLAILAQALSVHLDLDRPYWFWAGMHVWDWAVWSGLPAFALVIWGVARGLRRGLHAPEFPTLGAAVLATALIWTLSGTTRGESGRIWLLLTPFLWIAAAESLPVAEGRWRALLAAAQAAMTVALIGVIAAYSASDLTPPPAPTIHAPANPLDATFTASDGAAFRLTGWRAAREADGDLTLWLNWEGVARARRYHWFGTLLLPPDGALIESEPWQPTLDDGARFPTTCWGAGTRLTTQTRLALPDAAAPGDWYLSLAVFGDPAGPEGRLRARLADGADDVQVGIGPIRVE